LGDFFSLPIGGVAFIILVLALPNRFPHHMDKVPDKSEKPSFLASSRSFFWKADVIGAFLLLGTVVFLAAALEEGGTVNYPWDSAFIIASLVVSGCLAIAFLLWQWFAGKETTTPLPSFPRTFTHNRILLSSLL
jgi:hypothetical protein